MQESNKYVMLAASSSFKGKSDREKYGKAIQLAGCIDTVRKDYRNKIASMDRAERQLGVAMWVIDVLALRVGGEKGEDEADTVSVAPSAGNISLAILIQSRTSVNSVSW